MFIAFAEWTLRPRLLGGKGVAKVEMFGGERRQIQIRVNLDRLRVFSLGLTDVAAAVREAAGLRGGSFVETANQRILFRAAGLPMTAAELGEVMISPHGSSGVRLSEVARVMDGAEPKFGDAQIMGVPGVILLVSSQYGANTLEVTQALEQSLAEIQSLFASERVTLHTPLFRPANFILDSLHNINRSMLMGSVLVAGVLFLLLAVVFPKRRNLLLVLINLPFALVGGVWAAYFTGGVLSIGSWVGFVTLFGLTMRNSIVILGGLATSTILNLLVLPMLALRFGQFGTGTEVASATQLCVAEEIPG